MHIDFELSEQDYIHGQSQAMMPGFGSLKSRIQLLILPFMGLGFIVRSFFGGTTRLGPVLIDLTLMIVGVSIVLVPSGIFFLSFGWLRWRNRAAAKVIYRSSPALQARLSLNVNENGVEFAGQGFFTKATWPQFTKFFEDRRIFVLYRRNQEPGGKPIAFDIVPKRALSPEQITELRQYLQHNIGLAKRDPKYRPFAPSSPRKFH